MTHEATIAQAGRDYVDAVRAVERGGMIELAETATTYKALAAAVDAERADAPPATWPTMGEAEQGVWANAQEGDA